MKKSYIIVLVQLDGAHQGVTNNHDLHKVESLPGDVIEAVGPRGRIVDNPQAAKRYSSLKRALNAAQDWTWYGDVVRVIEVCER